MTRRWYLKTYGVAALALAIMLGAAGVKAQLTPGASGPGLPACSANQIPYTVDGVTYTCQDFVAWTTYAYNAANFDAYGATTWTVDNADESVKYTILGKTMWVAFDVMTTSVSDGSSAWLMITIPAGKTAAVASYTVVWATNNGAASEVGNASTGVGDTHIYIARFGSAGNWSAATNTTGVRGTVIFEIQ